MSYLYVKIYIHTIMGGYEMKKRLFGFLFICLSAILVFSGCSGGGGSSTKEGNAKEIIIGMVSEPDSVDIHRTSSSGDSNNAMYDTLLTMDNDGEIKPNIVTDYEVIEDGLAVIFQMKEGLKFHSGEPLDAEAVKLSMERLMDSSPFSTNAGDIDKIEVLDEYEFKITWNEPFAPFFLNATSPYLAPLDVSVLNSEGEEFEKNPSASGPLVLKEIKRGDSITYEANEDFNWNSEEGPGFEQVKFRFIPDEETRILEFKKGNINILTDVPYQYIEELEQEDDVTIERVPNYVLSYLGWNNKLPKFEDVRVRQAIAMAIDRDAIIQTTFNGEAQPVFGPLPTATFGHSEKIESLAQEKYAYDSEKAKELLADAGWNETDGNGVIMKDGEKFTIDLWVDDEPANSRAAQIIQNQLMEVGIDVSVSVKESAAIIEQTPKGQHEMLLWAFGWLDADVLNFLLFGKDKSTRLHYENKDIYELLDKGAIEMDQDARMKIYEEAQEMLVEESPWVPLYVKENITAVRGLDSFEIHPIRNAIVWPNLKISE